MVHEKVNNMRTLNNKHNIICKAFVFNNVFVPFLLFTNTETQMKEKLEEILKLSIKKFDTYQQAEIKVLQKKREKKNDV